MAAFFAAKAKASAIIAPLEVHLPQVLLELIACAKRLGYDGLLPDFPRRSHPMISKSHIRGALTTGSKWHFVVVDLDTDGDGAKYLVSRLIEIPGRSWDYIPDKSSLTPALIAGILSTWVSLVFCPP